MATLETQNVPCYNLEIVLLYIFDENQRPSLCAGHLKIIYKPDPQKLTNHPCANVVHGIFFFMIHIADKFLVAKVA